MSASLPCGHVVTILKKLGYSPGERERERERGGGEREGEGRREGGREGKGGRRVYISCIVDNTIDRSMTIPT